MTQQKRIFLRWWIGGTIIFAISIGIHAALITEAVPGGILDHQAAPDAASVNAIQQAWKSDGLMATSRLAMVSDLIFIVVYSIGVVLGGLYFRTSDKPSVSVLGKIVIAAGIVFFVTDMVETSLQLVQAQRFAGDDTLAAIASAMGPTKIGTWVVSFALLVVLLIVERLSSRHA